MRLPFELDPAIIHHIIHSQAGSIGKAVIELIMNSVDATAKTVTLSMTREGFRCLDDGAGFASREDVLRYFGRFGTPHEEGDATYGRFRLGRGQIMAHATTVWRSRDWQMTVDTQTMGYGYDLDDLEDGQAASGCEIVGCWYEPLTDTELLSATQEIRDLVRYTPVRVELNGRLITRDPTTEKWDFEDAYAWYRAKVEGAVSIYNQGVLVRHDPAQTWGAGGLIVSKKAIALNVSRTEILRKTCPVWKPIATQFGRMAKEISAQLGEHRKTEARREKAAHDLLAGDPNLLQIFADEEVVTLLPGKRQLSLYNFLELNLRMHDARVSVAENSFDVPKGEGIARQRIAQVVHPSTLGRFSCHNTEDFRDVIERILDTVRAAAVDQVALNQTRIWRLDRIKVPQFIDFKTLREAFIERTSIVTQKDALDRETRRLWTALRWCVEQYAGLCSGGERSRRSNALRWHDKHRKQILLGESNAYDAWTDGHTYIAFNIDIVKRLKGDPIKTAAYLFGLTEHEVSHDGDSIDCGHDEAFYQRYHDISIRMAPERQRYLHLFIQKYTYSMEGEGQRDRSSIWYEQRLNERANDGRQKRELGPVIEDQTAMPFFADPLKDEDEAFARVVNARLVESGALPPPPDWDAVRREAEEAQGRQAEGWRAERLGREELARRDAENTRAAQSKIAAVLGVAVEAIADDAWDYFFYYSDEGSSDDELRQLWNVKPWEQCTNEQEEHAAHHEYERDESVLTQDLVPEDSEPEAAGDDPHGHLDRVFHDLIEPGETWWSLERNAAAAGFFRVQDYLQWRQENAS